jgi:broad specificity phosphatase PhoE
MEAPGITRHRRPFLAPLWVTLLGALLLAVIGWTFYRSGSTTVVFLVRPVEKQPGTIDDPPLSPEGEARAQRLAQMFGGGAVDVIYESDDRSAVQTAAPLAERLHRAPVKVGSGDAPGVAARAVREHAGETLLVVASGPMLAAIVRELTGAPALPAAQAESDVVYVVSVPRFGRANLAHFRL